MLNLCGILFCVYYAVCCSLVPTRILFDITDGVVSYVESLADHLPYVLEVIKVGHATQGT